MNFKREPIQKLYQNLPKETKKRIIQTKKKNGKIVVVTGSGPNLHEGVTTLIAEFIHKGIVDGVTTSSALVAHEMAGTLEQIKRVDGEKLGFSKNLLPKGNIFELSILPPSWLNKLKHEMSIDIELIEKLNSSKGDKIIKAAGNMAYPLGLRTELLAKEIFLLARSKGISFEETAGLGADFYTMIGASRSKGIPCLVSVPQLIGGGMVGIAIADSISILERTNKIARMLEQADIIIESAIALTQEIHDGPFETYTGHGIWSKWLGYPTFSLKNKTIIRIDLDPNLKRAWEFERKSKSVQEAINKGLPKTKLMDIPFRMEMSGFARLDNSIPILGDIGVIWPVLALKIEQELGISLDFISYPQQSPEGQQMRKWIVQTIQPIEKKLLFQ
jgi:hypothetical protein